MKLEIEVHETDIIDQNEYADWWLINSEIGANRVSDAENGECRVRKGDKDGVFDLLSLTITWSDDSETDVESLANDNGHWDCPDDFDCTSIIWGVDNSGEPMNVVFGI